MPLSQKLELTKQDRVLAKFGERQEQNLIKVKEISKKIKRKPEESIINRSKNFRNKIEITKALETIKDAYDQTDRQHWCNHLRDYENWDYYIRKYGKKDINLEDIQEFYKIVKNKQFFESLLKENIYHVRNQSDGFQSKSKNLFPIKRNPYFIEKFDNYKKKMKNIFSTNDKNFENLMVKLIIKSIKNFKL